MASALQERQLLLLEKVNKRVDSIVEGQKKLEETISTHQNENLKLGSELANQERLHKSKRASKTSCRESSVDIPNDSRKLERRSASYELVQETMSPRERQLSLEVMYMDYMSSGESKDKDEEDVITGENERKLVAYLRKKFTWERTSLTKLKYKLDKPHRNNLIPHAKAMAKPRRDGGVSDRPAPDDPAWAVRLVSND